ncbi:MAG: GNAT family N-acetyltransferase [Oscillospiraceae bacterium]|nr:GNAT family N-acetyltransferase [Oscillospiraceae bacterium]
MIKRLNKTEILNALPLVWDVFCEFEAPNYPESGKKMFWDAIHDEVYLDSLTAFGAFEEDKLIGIIASRNEGAHVALFFVDGKYHSKGIGRSLWNALLDVCQADFITVHASLYAVPIYEKLGFVCAGNEVDDNGIKYVPMVFNNVIHRLQDKDDKKAYAYFKEVVAMSAKSNKYYCFFEEFASLIKEKSSYVRTRGFILCCAQAKWDADGKMVQSLPSLLEFLQDEKPTVVRQCLSALNELILYRPELSEMIKSAVEQIDLSKYKDSMVPLLKKDMELLLNAM